MYEIIPSVKRLFIYIFIIMGMTWLGVANYYYFAEEDIKFKGALITGIMFFYSGIYLWYMGVLQAKQYSQAK